MEEHNTTKKIGIITPCGMGEEVTSIAAALGSERGINIIVIDSKEKYEGLFPEKMAFKIEPIPKFELYTPPKTRAERRKEARKNIRK
jgi:hypothetical protein